MPQAAPIPALPIDDLERFAPNGVVASMDAAALGAFVRLLSHAWTQEPPCSLPADDASLAFHARTTAEEWARVKPAILMAFAPTDQLPEPREGNRTRLVNAVARGIFDQLAEKARILSDRQRRVALAKHHGPSHTLPPAPNGNPPGRGGMPAPSLRSESSSLLLTRSPSAHKSPRSPEQEQEDVCARLGEGARAIEEERIRAWRRNHAVELLQKAIAEWGQLGLTSCPVSKAREIASGEHATPARIDTVLEDIRGRIAAAKAGGKRFNPVGYLLCGLAMAENRHGHVRAAEVPLILARKWEQLEAGYRKTLGVAAAVEAISARTQSQPSGQARAGGA